MAAGEALKGKLDVFEHNPREGLVVVGPGGAAGAAEALDGWTDVSGRTKVKIKRERERERKPCPRTKTWTQTPPRPSACLFVFSRFP